MKQKKPYVATLDDVVITRKDERAVITYKEAGVPGASFQIGPEVVDMTDEEVLALFNLTLRCRGRSAAKRKHVAVEVPLNSPQIELTRSGQWVPRGGVIRCVVHDNGEGELVVEIDDRELTLHQFGSMLTTYAGWGMRIEFVPEDDLHRRPTLEVREPDED